MAVVAVLVFVAAYILIATERVPKMVTALVGAGIILGLGVASAEDVFYSHETGVVILKVGRSIWRRSKPTPDGKAARAERGGRGNLVPCLRSSVLHHRRNTSR